MRNFINTITISIVRGINRQDRRFVAGEGKGKLQAHALLGLAPRSYLHSRPTSGVSAGVTVVHRLVTAAASAAMPLAERMCSCSWQMQMCRVPVGGITPRLRGSL